MIWVLALSVGVFWRAPGALASETASETASATAPERLPLDITAPLDAGSRFDDLGASIEAELRILLDRGSGSEAPSPADSPRIAFGPPAPDAPADPAASVLQTAPDSRSIAEVTRVDPLGLPGSSAWADVSAPPLAEAIAADLALLEELVAAGVDRGTPSPRIALPLDPWLESVAPSVWSGLPVETISLAAVEATAGGETATILATLDRWRAESNDRSIALYVPRGSTLDAASLAPALRERGIVSVSGRGRSDVDAGLLAALDHGSDRELARLVALRALLGPPTGDTLKHSSAGLGEQAPPRLTYHRGTAADLGIALPWRLRLDAVTVGEAPSQPLLAAAGEAADTAGDRLGLAATRQRAVDANLDFRARSLATAASEQDLRRALAALRPQVAVSLDGSWVDQETAEASFGARPERLVTATGAATWLLFSERARSTVEIERRLLLARQLELDQVRLDLGLEATDAVLGVARAQAFERIAEESLARTRTELDAARDRRSVGDGGRAAVARLEARAARDRRALVEAAGQRQTTELALLRLLDRPLAAPASGAARALPADLASQPLPLETEVASPRRFGRLGEVLLERAFDAAPEIAAANALTRAETRGLLAARRSLLWPDVSAIAQVQTRLEESGAGTESPDLGLPQDGGSSFPEPPDDSWAVGVGVSLPILTGGARRSDIARAELRVEAADGRLAAARQRVEERVRRTLVGVETGYEAAFQARRAAVAAEEALEIVREAYRLGAETLTTLLDAQTEWRSARQQAAAATFDARARWLALERASGAFLDPSERAALAALLSSPPSAIEASTATVSEERPR